MVKTLYICMPTKLEIHANTMMCLLNISSIEGYKLDVSFLVGKSNIDQARSIMLTEWFNLANDDDLFLFVDSDQTFTSQDIANLIKLQTDVAVGVYSSSKDYPTCRPYNMQEFIKGTDKRVYYGATGFMLIRKPILSRVLELIKEENNGHTHFWVSSEHREIIPFFKQRLIFSETLSMVTPDPKDPSKNLTRKIPEWLGEDYAFCWMVRQVGGNILAHISPTIGHEVSTIKYFYPSEYNSKVWEEKTIVYYAGHTPMKWSPNGMNNNLTKGLGGSETAIVKLTEYWATQGYNVVVYGNVEPGKFNNVEYRSVNDFSINDKFNILILWRLYGMTILNNCKANKLFIDIHDEPSSNYGIILDHIDKISSILVRSEYHKSLFTSSIHNKVKCIENGVEDLFFSSNTQVPVNRFNNKRLIYCSSYDRGLIPMLKYGWPYIKSKVPDAELNICYGMELLADHLKKQVEPLLNQAGVIHHGRINHLNVKFLKEQSIIHYYIGGFSETDCISVKESVLSGCLPVVSDNNVFIERDYMHKISLGEPRMSPMSESVQIEAAKQIVKLLTDKEYYSEAINKITNADIPSWSTVGSKWIEMF